MGKEGPVLPVWKYVTVVSLLSHIVILETNSLKPNFMLAFKIQKECVVPGWGVPFAIPLPPPQLVKFFAGRPLVRVEERLWDGLSSSSRVNANNDQLNSVWNFTF